MTNKTTCNGRNGNGATTTSSPAANGSARSKATNGHAAAPVVLGDAYLAINQLAVYGAPVDAARECVKRGEDLEVSVRRMLDIGAALVQHGGNQATLDSVRSEVDRLVETVSLTVAENLPRSVKEQLAGFREVLGAYMDAGRAESVQRQLEKIMQAGARSQRQEVTKALLDEHGPFAVFKADLDGRLKGVGELLPHVVALTEQLSAAERVGAEHERGTAKGADYEQTVGETLAQSLAPFRDTVEHVGTELGSDRNRCGDYVATLNPATTGGADVRVVVECKARPRIGVRAAMTELEKAMGNREATAGLLVLDNSDGTALGGLSLRTYPATASSSTWTARNRSRWRWRSLASSCESSRRSRRGQRSAASISLHWSRTSRPSPTPWRRRRRSRAVSRSRDAASRTLRMPICDSAATPRTRSRR
jgi:hypothetical protein